MKIGDALITCPGCGESLTVDVYLHSVIHGYQRLRVLFNEGSADHDCEGR